MARRWDYGKIAENVAILGAQTTGTSVPISSGMGLYRALRGEGTPAEDKAFVERLLDEIDRWCQVPENRRRIDEIGGLSVDWRERLGDRLGKETALARAEAMALLFISLIDTPALRARSATLLGGLVDQLPELIVRAGDRHGALGALRVAVGADISRLEAFVGRLDPAQRRAGDRALIAAYLAKLADRLSIDNWSLRYGADPARLDAIQQRLWLVDATGEEGHVEVDELVESCQRLVILGDPGSGKSWSARRAVIRSARAALAQLETLDSELDVDGVELPLVATCAEVIDPGEQQRWDRFIAASLRRAATSPRHARRLDEVLAGHRRFLIVLDGLDEAAGVESDAIHELIDTYPGEIRAVVTSRPGAQTHPCYASPTRIVTGAGPLSRSPPRPGMPRSQPGSTSSQTQEPGSSHS